MAETVHGKAVGVFPLPSAPNWLSIQGQVFSERSSSALVATEPPALWARANVPDRRQPYCFQEILVFEDALDAGAKPESGWRDPRLRFPSLPTARTAPPQPSQLDPIASSNLSLGP